MRSIKIDNLSFQYKKDNPIFSELTCSLGIEDNEGFVETIMSPSGIGKTTLLKLILGIEKPQAGNIELNNELSIGYVPQEAILLEHLTPIQNANYFSMLSSLKKKYNYSLFNELASLMDMDNVLSNSKNIDQISGGQKQRLSLLRALSVEPNILLLDEPCSGLDAKQKIIFLDILLSIIKKQKILLIYVTHHIDEAKYISDRISYLGPSSDGVSKMSQQSPFEFIKSPPCVEASFLCAFPCKMTIPVKFEEEKLVLCKNNFTHYIFFSEENLVEVDYNEDFTYVRSNSLYTTLYSTKLDDFIIIPEINKRNKYHKMTGEVVLYNQDGSFCGLQNID